MASSQCSGSTNLHTVLSIEVNGCLLQEEATQCKSPSVSFHSLHFDMCATYSILDVHLLLLLIAFSTWNKHLVN